MNFTNLHLPQKMYSKQLQPMSFQDKVISQVFVQFYVICNCSCYGIVFIFASEDTMEGSGIKKDVSLICYIFSLLF